MRADRDTLLRLAERCEAATGSDRRLDAEIACAIRHRDLRPAEPGNHAKFQTPGYPPRAGDIWTPSGFLMAPIYTASLDEALTLVPEGHAISLHIDADGSVFAGVALDNGVGCEGASPCGATPALSICAAALRARAATAGDAGEGAERLRLTIARHVGVMRGRANGSGQEQRRHVLRQVEEFLFAAAAEKGAG